MDILPAGCFLRPELIQIKLGIETIIETVFVLTSTITAANVVGATTALEASPGGAGLL